MNSDVIHIWLNTSVSDYYIISAAFELSVLCVEVITAMAHFRKVNHFNTSLSLSGTFILTHRHCIVLHTCRWFSLHSRGEWAIVEACEAVSPLPRFHISIVSIDQDLPQCFALSVNMNEVTLHRQRNEGGTQSVTVIQEHKESWACFHTENVSTCISETLYWHMRKNKKKSPQHFLVRILLLHSPFHSCLMHFKGCIKKKKITHTVAVKCHSLLISVSDFRRNTVLPPISTYASIQYLV